MVNSIPGKLLFNIFLVVSNELDALLSIFASDHCLHRMLSSDLQLFLISII